MFDAVAARFKGVFATFEEEALRPAGEAATSIFATRGRAGDGATLGIGLVVCVTVVDAVRRIVGSGSVGDFAVVAADEPVAIFADPSVPDFTFFCRFLISMRLPVSLTTTAFGGLSKARRSIIRIFPFSVPAYMLAPSGEKSIVVRGTLTLRVRKSLDIKKNQQIPRTSQLRLRSC